MGKYIMALDQGTTSSRCTAGDYGYFAHGVSSFLYILLLFSVLKVVKGGRIRTMVIAHSPAQRSSELTANCD